MFSGGSGSTFGYGGHAFGTAGYGNAIGGLSFSGTGASTGQYGRDPAASETFTPNGDGTYSLGDTTSPNFVGPRAETTLTRGDFNDGNGIAGKFDVTQDGSLYTDNLTGKTLNTNFTDSDEARAYGITPGQLQNARHFEGLGGAVENGVFPANKPYMDAKTGKLTDPGGLAKAEGYGMRGGNLVQRNAFGAAGMDFLGDYGKIALGLFPGMTMGFMGLDKVGAFDKSYGPTGPQSQFAGQSGGGSHGGSGGSTFDMGMPTEGLGLTKTADPAKSDTPNKGALLADWFKSNPNANDIRLRQAQDANGWSNADVAAARKMDPSMWQARYNAATPYFQFSSMVDNALADPMNDDPSAGRTRFVLGNRAPRSA